MMIMSHRTLPYLLLLISLIAKTVYGTVLLNEKTASYAVLQTDETKALKPVAKPLQSPKSGERYMAFIEKYQDQSFKLKVYRFPSRPPEPSQYTPSDTQDYFDIKSLLEDMVEFISVVRLQEAEILLTKETTDYFYTISEIRNLPEIFLRRKIFQRLNEQLFSDSVPSPTLPAPLVYDNNSGLQIETIECDSEHVKNFMNKQQGKKFTQCYICKNEFPVKKLTKEKRCELCQQQCLNTEHSIIEADGIRLDEVETIRRHQTGHGSYIDIAGHEHKAAYRALTFRDYPWTTPDQQQRDNFATKLATAGYVWTGFNSLCKCYSCGVHLIDARLEDNLMSAFWHSPDCSLLTNNPNCNNLPIFKFLTNNTPQQPPNRPLHNIQEPPRQTVGTHTPYQQLSSVNRPPAVSQQPPHDLPFTPNTHYPQGMNDEQQRLRTFNQSHGILQQKSQDLARIGFYLISGGSTQCFSCNLKLSGWEANDDVFERHRRNKEECFMLLPDKHPHNKSLAHTAPPRPASPAQRVTMTAEQARSRAQPLPYYGMAAPHSQMVSAPGASHIINGSQVGQIPSFPGLSQYYQRLMLQKYPCNYANSPHMSEYENRLESFTNQNNRYRRINPPEKIWATPEQLAEAGFLWRGESDHVECWYCGIPLQGWEPQDDPWVEHAKWSSRCEFLYQQRGDGWADTMANQYRYLPNRPDIDNRHHAGYSLRHPLRQCSTRVYDTYNQDVQTAIDSTYATLGIQLTEMGYTEAGIRKALQTNPFSRWNHESLLRALNYLTELTDECAACMVSAPNVSLIPCGHVCYCQACLDRFLALPEREKKCPLCRKPVTTVVVLPLTPVP